MTCQNIMLRMPATLKISEKPRKYHFFPRKSMLVLRKNSIGLNAQRFSSFFSLQPGIENHSRHKHRSKDVGEQTESEGHGKAADRPGAKNKQDEGRNNGGHVGIHDGEPSPAESLIYIRCRRRA